MTTAAEKLPTSAPQVHMVQIGAIKPSPSNPRKNFADIDDLAEDLKIRGILQPVLLRPRGEDFELVFGERRWRAAKKAGFEQVPAFVRELGDQEALGLQIVENVKRTDIHPVEEAEAYRELHEKHGLSVVEIAAKVGRSKSHILGRIKLCELAEPVKKAALAGELPATHALLIARIPAALQEEALKKILAGEYDEGPMSFRDAQEFVLGEYTLRLADAPWSLKDEHLVAEAGSCSACPKRTGNQPELFADVKAKDTCTDPACFKKKKQAYVKSTLQKAQDDGRAVTSAVEAKKALKSGSYVDLDKKEYIQGHGYKSYRELLGKKQLETTLAPAPEGVKELVKKEDVEKVLKIKQHKNDQNVDWKKQQEKNAAEAERRKAVADAIIGEISKKISTKGLGGKPVWFILAEMAVERELRYNELSDDFVRRWLEREPNPDHPDKDIDELQKRLPKLKQEQLQAFVLESWLGDDVHHQLRRGEKGAINEFARALGIDEKKVADRAKAELAGRKKLAEKALEKGVVDETGEVRQVVKKAAPAKKAKKK